MNILLGCVCALLTVKDGGDAQPSVGAVTNPPRLLRRPCLLLAGLVVAALAASCAQDGARRTSAPAQAPSSSGGASPATTTAQTPAAAPTPTTAASSPAAADGGIGALLRGAVAQALPSKKQAWAYWDQRPGFSDTRHWCLMDPVAGTKFTNAVRGEPARYRDGSFGIQEKQVTIQSCAKLEEAGKLTIVGYHATVKALDRVGLRNILPQYDEDQPLTNQFPRVAVTVLESPPDWAYAFPQPRAYTFGCWKLAATVWETSTKSRKVPEFQFCLPQDGSDEVAFGFSATWPSRAEKDIAYLTGLKRTDGPRPPATVMPTDRETAERALAHRGGYWQRAVAARLYYETPVGNMLGILRYQMGTRDGGTSSHDMRVWIVEIRN